jgi:PAS domain-containing protein
MLGYAAADVTNKITPADISDPQEVIARAQALSLELGTLITPGFEALVFKASRGIEDIYELTYIRKDGSRFPAVVSVTALRDEWDGIIGYLLIGTDNSARKQAEEALLKAGALQNAIFNSANFSSIATDEKGVIQLFNVGAERMLGYLASEVLNKITPADISDSQEVIARAKALSVELATPITPGFEALVFKASRGIEDIYIDLHTEGRQPLSRGCVGHRIARSARRNYRLPFDRHGQYRAQTGGSRARTAGSAPARSAVLHALSYRIQHRCVDDHQSLRHHHRRQQADVGAHRLHAR